jgi:hypothetical protein
MPVLRVVSRPELSESPANVDVKQGTCVVDKDVDSAEGARGPLDSGCDPIFMTDVHRQRKCATTSAFDLCDDCVNGAFERRVRIVCLCRDNKIRPVTRSAIALPIPRLPPVRKTVLPRREG